MPRQGFGRAEPSPSSLENLGEALHVDLGFRKVEVEGVAELLGMGSLRHLGQGLHELPFGMEQVAQVFDQAFVDGIGLGGHRAFERGLGDAAAPPSPLAPPPFCAGAAGDWTNSQSPPSFQGPRVSISPRSPVPVRVVVELVDDARAGRDAANREGRLLHAFQRCGEGLHVGDLARHQELQRILAARIVTEIDQALIDDLGARFGRDVAAEIDVELAGDLEIVRRPRASHGIVEIDAAAACDGDQRIGLRRIAVMLHVREVKPGQRAHHLEMAQLLRADVHQQVLAGRIIAVEALDRILHGSGQLAIGAAELLQQHVAEARVRRIDTHRVHELLDVVIHGALLTPRGLAQTIGGAPDSVPAAVARIAGARYSAACLTAARRAADASWMRLKVASAWPTTWSML